MPVPNALTRAATPLAFAGYLTWSAVALETWLASARWAPVAGLPARLVVVALLAAFLVAFVVRQASGPRDYSGFDTGLVAMTLSPLALLALGRSGTAAVLLIVLAAVVTAAFRPRAALAYLAAVNAAFLGVLAFVWRVDYPFATFAIYAAFQAFAAIVTAALARAERTAEELRSVNAELLVTRSLLAERVRDGERLRVSRELHDVVGHKLTALTMNLELIGDVPGLAARREYAVASALTRELLADVRQVVSRLRRDDGVALHDALAQLAAPFPRPHVHVDVGADVRAPDADRAEIVLRTAQEALTNAARHSTAQNVWLSLRNEGPALALAIEDDGRYPGALAPGNGLTGMRERLEAVGGRLEVGRGSRGGVRIAATLPHGATA